MPRPPPGPGPRAAIFAARLALTYAWKLAEPIGLPRVGKSATQIGARLRAWGLAIWKASRELMVELIKANGIEEDDVASVIFTTTPDLTAAYPAKAARDLGWHRTALMG